MPTTFIRDAVAPPWRMEIVKIQ